MELSQRGTQDRGYLQVLTNPYKLQVLLAGSSEKGDSTESSIVLLSHSVGWKSLPKETLNNAGPQRT